MTFRDELEAARQASRDQEAIRRICSEQGYIFKQMVAKHTAECARCGECYWRREGEQVWH